MGDIPVGKKVNTPKVNYVNTPAASLKATTHNHKAN